MKITLEYLRSSAARIRLARGRTGIAYIVAAAIISITAGGFLLASTRNSAGNLVPIEAESLIDSETVKAGGDGFPTGYFRVVNHGGSQVRVLRLLSSCGCAEAKIEPNVIAPGASARVSVKGTPPAVGESLATVTLETDSKLTPTVQLRLRMIGSRKPPFLLRAGGDLSFTGDLADAEVREIIAVTIESDREKKVPFVQNAFSFLDVGPPELSETKSQPNGTVQKMYIFKVKLKSRPPEKIFSGELSVIDPWDSDRKLQTRLSVVEPTPFHIVPSRLIIRVASDETSSRSSKFLVRSRDPMVGPSFETTGPIVLEKVDTSSDLKTLTVTLRLRTDSDCVPGVYEIKIKPNQSSGFLVKLPVKVEEGEN